MFHVSDLCNYNIGWVHTLQSKVSNYSETICATNALRTSHDFLETFGIVIVIFYQVKW